MIMRDGTPAKGRGAVTAVVLCLVLAQTAEARAGWLWDSRTAGSRPSSTVEQIAQSSGSPDVAAEADRQAFSRWAEFSSVFSTALLRTMAQAETLLQNADAGPGGAQGPTDRASAEAARVSRAMLRQVDRELDRSLTVPVFRDRRLTDAAKESKARLIDAARDLASFINDAENYYITATRRDINLAEERDPLRLRLEGMRLTVTNLDSKHAALSRPPESVEAVLLEAAYHMGEAVRAFIFVAADTLRAGEGGRVSKAKMEPSAVEIDYAEGLLDEADLGVEAFLQRVDGMQRILLRDKHALKRLGRAMRAGVKNERELAALLRDGINGLSRDGIDGDKIIELLDLLTEQREDRQNLEQERHEIRESIPPELLLQG